MGIIALIIGQFVIYAIAYALAIFLALVLAIYLPSLFMYKLYQINKKVMKSQAETSRTNSMTNKSSVGRVTRRTTDINGDNAILTVIRKCTILTIFSLLSTWSIFICVMIAIFGKINTGILIFWGYALTLDAVANFMCVMLSNSFCDDYYVKWCGWIDSCVGKCCFKDEDRVRVGSVSPKSAEKELSSWMESSHSPHTEACTETSNNKVNETNENDNV